MERSTGTDARSEPALPKEVTDSASPIFHCAMVERLLASQTVYLAIVAVLAGFSFSPILVCVLAALGALVTLVFALRITASRHHVRRFVMETTGAIDVCQLELRKVRSEVVGRDTIIENLRAELLLAQSRQGSSITDAHEAIAVMDRHGAIVQVNPAFARLWQMPAEIAEHADGRSRLSWVLARLAHPELFLGAIKDLFSKPEGSSRDLLECVDGRIVERSFRAHRQGDSIEGKMWSFHDVTERERLSNALVASRALYSSLIENLPVGVFRTDDEGRFTYVNRTFVRLVGIPEEDLVGKSGSVVWPLELAGQIERQGQEILTSGQGDERVVELPSDDGQTSTRLQLIRLPVTDDDGERCGLQGIVSDVTLREKLDIERSRANKLESIGVLAGGVAHDFNNLLMVVLGNLSLMRMSLESGIGSLKEYLDHAEDGALRAKEMTQHLLSLGRNGSQHRRRYEAVPLFELAVRFSMGNSNLKPVFDFPQGLWQCEVDESEIAQVCHQIAINAAEAMPQGGEFLVRAENVILSGNAGVDLPSGKYLKISFRDEGEGILPEHLARVFDPYFSTKRQGAGMGLAIAYSIARRHRGTLTVESRIGSGSTFILFLPAFDGVTATTETRQAVIPVSTPFRGRLLVMDDEPGVRFVAQKLLMGLGYKVDLASNGEEAVRAYKAVMDQGQRYDVVIMDLTVRGGMGGKEATRRLLEVDPTARVIVCSGYTNHPVIEDPARFGFRGVIVKPYTVKQVEQVLVEVAA